MRRPAPSLTMESGRGAEGFDDRGHVAGADVGGRCGQAGGGRPGGRQAPPAARAPGAGARASGAQGGAGRPVVGAAATRRVHHHAGELRLPAASQAAAPGGPALRHRHQPRGIPAGPRARPGGPRRRTSTPRGRRRVGPGGPRPHPGGPAGRRALRELGGGGPDLVRRAPGDRLHAGRPGGQRLGRPRDGRAPRHRGHPAGHLLRAGAARADARARGHRRPDRRPARLRGDAVPGGRRPRSRRRRRDPVAVPRHAAAGPQLRA